MSPKKKVLVVRNDKIGDLVLATPLLDALKRSGYFVGVLASPYAAPLLETDPAVDVLIQDTNGSMEAVRGQGFGVALLLWGNWRNAWMLWRAGIPEKIGTGSRPFSFLLNRRLAVRRSEAAKSEARYNLDFLAGLGLDASVDTPARLHLGEADKAAARAWLKAKKLKAPVILHPGSRGSAQNWGPGRYAELGKALKKLFGFGLLVTCGPGEEAAAGELAKACGAVAMQDVLPLRTFAALCGEASLFVSASTGPMHMAAALGAPTLSLFPPLQSMSPLRWSPYGANPRAVLSPRGLGSKVPDSGENLVERITVEEAAAAAGFLLRDRLA